MLLFTQIDEAEKQITTLRPKNLNVNRNSDKQEQQNLNVNEENAEYEDQNKNEIDADVMQARPWYFSNGERYPREARINKKTNKRLAKLTPAEDVRGDRITNQLMFIPPNYENVKDEGRLKTILLYNGLGPWNVKQGKEIYLYN